MKNNQKNRRWCSCCPSCSPPWWTPTAMPPPSQYSGLTMMSISNVFAHESLYAEMSFNRYFEHWFGLTSWVKFRLTGVHLFYWETNMIWVEHEPFEISIGLCWMLFMKIWFHNPLRGRGYSPIFFQPHQPAEPWRTPFHSASNQGEALIQNRSFASQAFYKEPPSQP